MDKLNGVAISHGYQPQYAPAPPTDDSALKFSEILLAHNHDNQTPATQQENRTPLEMALADGHLTDQEARLFRNSRG
uniref:Uncharacterized protein n=1 Tax=uncultured Thiotrichaceae bacterium TaxID=298394 RepID=A0A6S6TN55_9GAMM|nr:MAG: Unknown protein [uncultured Thiotrichaceae bacterium]